MFAIFQAAGNVLSIMQRLMINVRWYASIVMNQPMILGLIEYLELEYLELVRV